MNKQTAIYMRVSSNGQKFASQLPDLKRWIQAQNPDELGTVKWFKDKSTGRNADRPGFQKLMDTIDRGEVGRIVIWRLDRISRSVADLCQLLKILKSKRVNLVSLRESIDLKTASGRLLVNILGSIAEFESELKSERILAGQAAARAKGKTWGGSQRGRLAGISIEQAKTIVKLHGEGMKMSGIARSVNVHRSSCYRIVRNFESGLLKV